MLTLGLQILSILRALVEVAGLFLLAQGVLYLLIGGTRDENVVYQLFRIVTRPAISLTRVMMPRVIPDRSIPFVSFVMLFTLWILLAYIRLAICKSSGLVCG